MIGLCIEFSIVLALFAWLWRRQVRERARARRVPPSQLPLIFDPDER